MSAGPLAGVRVIEFEGLGPAPLAGHWLTELGASVTLVRRVRPLAVKQSLGAGIDRLDARKCPIAIDLKHPEGRDVALALVERNDVLMEGNRPGVMERLGLGPDVCLARQPSLVYARVTGWGQDGPLAQAAGHDLNYVALTGLLALSARPGTAPIVPPTVIGDAAGALGLAFGIVCALLQARATGRGLVVDAAMVDIASMLGGLVHSIKAGGAIDSGRPSAFHDSPFYDVYRCADGRFITLAALEPQFYALLLDKLGLDGVDPAEQYDSSLWPALKTRVAESIAKRTRDEWSELLEGSDACFAPVLDLDEAVRHPHVAARGSLRADACGGLAAPVAPRLRDGTGEASGAVRRDAAELLAEAGFDGAQIAALQAAGALGPFR